MTARFSTADGTATSNTFPRDYQPVTNRFVGIPPGFTSQTVTVPVFGDFLIESDETFFVNLSNPLNGTLGDAQGIGTILNDDSPGTLQFSAAAYTVAENGGSATITVSRTGGATGTVTVHFSTSDGTATAGSDYTAASGT